MSSDMRVHAAAAAFLCDWAEDQYKATKPTAEQAVAMAAAHALTAIAQAVTISPPTTGDPS